MSTQSLLGAWGSRPSSPVVQFVITSISPFMGWDSIFIFIFIFRLHFTVTGAAPLTMFACTFWMSVTIEKKV